MALDPFSDLLLQKDNRIIASIPVDEIDFDIKDGDLALASNEINVKESLIRRLRTPLGAYQALVVTYTEAGSKNWVYYDSTYGSMLHTFISEPLTNHWVKNFTDTVVRVISEDTRISVTDINLDIVDISRGKINLSITYEITGVESEQTIRIGSNESSSLSIS